MEIFLKKQYKIAYYCTGNIWNIGGGATVIKNILENTAYEKDEQLLFVSSWIDLPKTISSKFTVIRLKTSKNRIFQELYDQVIGPVSLLKYSIEKVICLNSIVPLLYPNRVDVFYQMRMFHFEEFDNISKKIKNIIGILSIKKAHTVFVASEDHKQDLIKNINNIKNKVKVNYLGYNPIQKESTNNIDLFENYLLFVSVIRPYKNLDRLIKAYKNILDKVGKSTPILLIAGNIANYKGSDKYMENIYNFIKKNELEEFIIFKGAEKHEDIIHLMKKSKALVFPSLFEGFGIPVLEAMANRVPVLTSNRDSLREVGSDTVIYFDPESIADMEGKIMDLLEHGYDKELIEKAFLRSKFFDWKKTTEAIENDLEYKIGFI